MSRSLDSQLDPPTVQQNQGQSCGSCPPIKDSEQEVATKPAQKEGVISLKDTAMSIGTLKAEQLSSKVILTCESCSYKTTRHHRTFPAKQDESLLLI